MRHPVKKRNDEVDAGAEDRAQASKSFDDVFLGLRDNADPEKDAQDDKAGEQQQNKIVTDQAGNEVFHEFRSWTNGFRSLNTAVAANSGRVLQLHLQNSRRRYSKDSIGQSAVGWRNPELSPAGTTMIAQLCWRIPMHRSQDVGRN